MNGFHWSLLAWWAFNALGVVLLVGKQRDPITPGVAAVLVIIYGVMIWWTLQQAGV